ncbi:MAG: NUDIX domain-containing protein [Candidatus Thorarchaeota archaeon]|nr:MAG: NUDIX domain-containing protein [Candidatus Thorarchaeota archaeon]
MKQFYVAMGAIVESDKGVLILKRSPEKDFAPDTWEVVTGRLEMGENPEEGIIREIAEETGIQAELIMPVHTSFFYRGSEEYPMVFIDFWCRYLEGDVKLSWEHSEYEWVSLGDALRNPDLKPFHSSLSRILGLKSHLPSDFSFEE